MVMPKGLTTSVHYVTCSLGAIGYTIEPRCVVGCTVLSRFV
jgi:hypothetical protein